MAKKYRVIKNFSYRGPDGTSKKSFLIGPGEEVPKLDGSERNRLLQENRIAEVDMYGVNIPHRKTEELDDSKIDMLLRKSSRTIIAVLNGSNYSENTLGKMYAEAEKRKMPRDLLELIESKIK